MHRAVSPEKGCQLPDFSAGSEVPLDPVLCGHVFLVFDPLFSRNLLYEVKESFHSIPLCLCFLGFLMPGTHGRLPFLSLTLPGVLRTDMYNLKHEFVLSSLFITMVIRQTYKICR